MTKNLEHLISRPMAHLPSRKPTTRDVVTAMTRDRWTPREIASALNISTQTVYWNLKAAGLDPVVRKAPKE